MPSRTRPRAAMYNTPIIRTGGFGALQVEALTNRPQSIARRHLAASQLRMREIEPDELSSSEWVQFLVMEERQRERWMMQFVRQRRHSAESTSSTEEAANDKAEEARLEAEEAGRAEASAAAASSSAQPQPAHGQTPAVSLWVRQFDGTSSSHAQLRPLHARHAVAAYEAPPAYNSVTRARTPPPAYEPRSDDEEPSSPLEMRRPTHLP